MSEFTIADNSSKPYAHMIDGVQLSSISDSVQYVRDYAEAGINATNYGEQTDAEIMAEWLESGELEEAAEYIQSRIDEEIGILHQVMTTAEVAEEFGITDAAVRMTIQRGSITARQSGSTWLVKRSDAEKRWAQVAKLRRTADSAIAELQAEVASDPKSEPRIQTQKSQELSENERIIWKGAGWYAPIMEGGKVVSHFVAPPDVEVREAYDMARQQQLGTPALYTEKP